MSEEDQQQRENEASSSPVQSEEEQEDTSEETVDLRILDPTTTDLDLNHGRIGKIENLEPLTQLETLSLRWNLIKQIENLNCLGDTLTELELYQSRLGITPST